MLNKQQTIVREKLKTMRECLAIYPSRTLAVKRFINLTGLTHRHTNRYYNAVRDQENHISRGHEQGQIDKRKCYFCGNDENLQIHHIDKNRSNNIRKNLMVLCARCHAKLHYVYKKWSEDIKTLH